MNERMLVMEQLYKITQLREKYNISTRTLRWYEEKGLIESLRTPDYHYRMYTKDMVRRLEYILYFRKMGIGLQEIAVILKNNTPESISKLIKEKRLQIDEQIQRLNQQRDAILGNLTGFSKSLDSEKEELLAALTQGEATSLALHTLNCLEKDDREYRSDNKEFRVENGELILWDRERCVFTEGCFTPPLTFHIVAKTSKENLRFYFGPLELIFNWEVEPSFLVFYDHEHSHILKIPVGDLIPPDQFVTIFWHISDATVACWVNHTLCFSLERPFSSYDPYPLGFGTLPGNRITLRQVAVFQKSAEIPVDLTKILPEELPTQINQEGQLVIHHTGDTLRLVSGEEFEFPLIYTAVAKVSNENLRLFLGEGVLILNWEKKSLLWWDPATGEERIFPRMGYITPGRFHTIRQIFAKDAYVLEIDGIAHLIVKDLPYMERLKQGLPIRGKVGIGTAFGNTVTVQSIAVTPLKPKK